MKKQELLELKKIVLDQKREQKRLEQNSEFFYKKIWEGLIDEFRNDIYGQKNDYRVFLNYDLKNQIMENIIMPVIDMDGGLWIRSFPKDLRILQRDLVSLLAVDGLTIVSRKSNKEHDYEGYVSISKEDILKFAFDEKRNSFK